MWNFVSKVMSLLFNMLFSFVIAFFQGTSIFFLPMALSKDLYFIERDSTTANWVFKLKYKIYHQSMDRIFNFMAALTIRSDFGA